MAKQYSGPPPLTINPEPQLLRDVQDGERRYRR